MRIRSRVAATLLAGVVFGAIAVAVAQPAFAAGNPTRIKNNGSGLCVEVALGDEPYNGAVLQQNKCSLRPEPRQLWYRVPASAGGYYLVNQANGKCMDVWNGRDADRTPVQLWDCTAYNGMYWHFVVDTPTKVISPIGPRCLDVAAGSLQPGAKLQTYHCTVGNYAQSFTLA